MGLELLIVIATIFRYPSPKQIKITPENDQKF